jgi:membrane associated rhomboid family serine protease
VPAPVGVLCVDCARDAEHASRAARSRAKAATRGGWATVTTTLIAMNVAFYLYGTSTGVRAWETTYGLVPAWGLEEPWRLVTSGFVHFGVVHLGLNMLMLYQFGRQLEAVLGWLRFTVLYGISMLGGSFAILFVGSDLSIHAGASGAIFGLFAAFGVLLYSRKLPWQSLAMSAGIWLVAGFIIPGISWEGHLGGGIAGGITMLVMIALERQKRQNHQVR